MMYLFHDQERVKKLRLGKADMAFTDISYLIDHLSKCFSSGEVGVLTTDFTHEELTALDGYPWRIKIISVHDDKDATGKIRPTLVPPAATRALATVMTWGIEKKGYKEGAWKNVPPEKWRDAGYRHFLCYLENPESVDDESGLPHLWHLLFNVSVLIGQGATGVAPTETRCN